MKTKFFPSKVMRSQEMTILFANTNDEYEAIARSNKVAFLGGSLLLGDEFKDVSVRYPLLIHASIAMQKNSEFTEIFNFYIKNYRESGILKAMHQTAFHGRICGIDKGKESVQSIEGKAPSLADLHYALIGSGSVLVVALVLLLCEVCWDNVHTCSFARILIPNKKRKNQSSE